MNSAEKDTPTSKLEQDSVREFSEHRQIQPEDFDLVEQLLDVPGNLIIEWFHNYFNTNRERSADQLRRDIQRASETGDTELKAVYELFLPIVEKYGWHIAYNLVRVLEGEA